MNLIYMKIQISFVSILNLYNLDNKIQITKMIKKILYKSVLKKKILDKNKI